MEMVYCPYHESYPMNVSINDLQLCENCAEHLFLESLYEEEQELLEMGISLKTVIYAEQLKMDGNPYYD